MAYSKSLSESRLYKYQSLFNEVDLLPAGKKELFEWESAEEAKAAREALYNHWKVQKRTPFFTIEFVGRSKKTFCVTNNFPKEKQKPLSANGQAGMENLAETCKQTLLKGTYTPNEILIVMSFLRNEGYISSDTYGLIDKTLKEIEDQQTTHLKDQAVQQAAEECFGSSEEQAPKEEQANLDWEAVLTKQRKENTETLALAKTLYPEKFEDSKPSEKQKQAPKQASPKEKQSLKQILTENALKHPDQSRPTKNPVPNPFQAEKGESL